jgi:rSAM/selenodomain-associated transferase 2
MQAPRISLIIPCLDEGAIVAAALGRLQPLRQSGVELILVDGGSRDDTPQQALGLVDLLLGSPPGRARQMNAGARAARGEVLWFLHLDSAPFPGAVECLLRELSGGGSGWGRFDIRLDGDAGALRLVERLMNMRSRLSGIATGDQGIFVSRSLFEAVGGFPDLALMEDVALSRRLKRHGRPICIRRPIVTSSRRWERDGVWRTIALMWRLRLGYSLGESPERLARRYRACSSPTPGS